MYSIDFGDFEEKQTQRLALTTKYSRTHRLLYISVNVEFRSIFPGLPSAINKTLQTSFVNTCDCRLIESLALNIRNIFREKMDPKEVRESLGKNHHFNPKMNPNIPVAGNQTKQNWWSTTGKPQPLQVRIRQDSVSSDTSSPVGSPTTATDFSQFERRNSKTLYTSFGFAS
ncbi:uncharacterized protein LOC123524082 [Mercenaria mercenaria]|uniref:uncharacterized protein LOC123524082 n=1 Tax=Mercenaria mercenaria TaxID=6596 RepID=UPI00234F843E|nr:uncharacterized protein LOC123524082 [Mercenaria mercenaria]